MAMKGCEGNAHQLCGTQPSMIVLPRELELEGDENLALQSRDRLICCAGQGQQVSGQERDRSMPTGVPVGRPVPWVFATDER
jgi:hypothetical protein